MISRIQCDCHDSTWSMSDLEVELWEGVLRCAFTHASAIPIEPAAIMEDFVQGLEKDKFRTQVTPPNVSVLDMADFLLGDSLSRSPRLTLILFSHVTLVGQKELPRCLFSLVNITLYDLYPPLPEHFSTCFRFLQLTRDIIMSAPSLLVVPVLVTLRKSLCRWIEDKSKILLEKEYNHVVCPYSSLDKISSSPLGHAFVL
jgi:hypothetical protein